MHCNIALLGLSPKDQNLVEIVVSRVASTRHSFHIHRSGSTGSVNIAIVDHDNPRAEALFEELRQAYPEVVAVCVSNDGKFGNSPHRIERKLLLLRILRLLEEVVAAEFEGGKARMRIAASTPTPLPQARSAAAAITGTDPGFSPRLDDTPRLRALVVDDSPAVREQLCGALKRSGITVETAENGAQALSVLQHQGFDIAFLDVVMPGMDGYELCRKMKANAYLRSTPVLMLTSRSSPFDRARGALAGCDAYLVKPLTWDTFYQTVHKTLTRHFGSDLSELTRRGYRLAQSA